MRVLVYSAHSYDRTFLSQAGLPSGHELEFTEASLGAMTASLSRGFPCVCCFVNDHLDAEILDQLAAGGTRFIALRCAGFNNVDLKAAERHGVTVARVPAYSPQAVAEYTIGLILTLLRKIHRAYVRVREGNFSLEGLMGLELHGSAVGVVGAGRIGSAVCQILASGLGCKVLVFDPFVDAKALGAGVVNVEWPELLARSKVITLHCPMTPKTHHLIDESAIARMKDRVVLINTSRGAIVEARAVIGGLKSGKIGAFGMDVYEEEGDTFYHDLSERIIQDDTLARLMTFPNALVTGHQAFFTRPAMEAIARTTIQNLDDFERGVVSPNALVHAEVVRPLASPNLEQQGKTP